MPMYQKTYFDIDSDYRWGIGYSSDEARAAFQEESSELFEKLGWSIKPGEPGRGICDTALKGKQELYLHPMQFSGVIRNDEISEIEGALHTAKTFRLRETRCFDRYEDMSDEAYAAYLDEHRGEMVQAILSAYTTKRRNLFVAGDISERIGKPFQVLRLASKEERGDLAYDRVKALTEELIRDGRLITAQTRHGRGIRAAALADARQSARTAKTHDGR